MRSPARCELPPLLGWLDQGLRDGRPDRIRAEYPVAIRLDRPEHHVLVERGRRFASHALARTIDVESGGDSVRLGMIGLVYTDPTQRGRGLASRCVEEATARLESAGAEVIGLWSDRHTFYARLGYRPGGRERLYAMDPEVCRRVERAGGAPESVSRPHTTEWPALESLYRTKPVHARRRAGDLRQLASAPDCDLRVARIGGHPVAYAALGRGDDFRGVVHEWAGDPDGILACVAPWVERLGRIALLAGPAAEELTERLDAAGTPVERRSFALLRVPHPERLWDRLGRRRAGSSSIALTPEPAGRSWTLSTPRGRCALSRDDVTGLLFGPELPVRVLDALPPGDRRRLAAELPWPLFVWGFDSI